MLYKDPECRNFLRKSSGSRRTSEGRYIIRDGIILIDKPDGLTSHDIVDFITGGYKMIIIRSSDLQGWDHKDPQQGNKLIRKYSAAREA